MSDKLDETIQAIAIRHGVVLGKDDPLLILQTMHERLLDENRKAQQDLLVHFKEEIEKISSQWKNDAKEKAENILNAALAGSKEAMGKVTSEFFQLMKKKIDDSLSETRDMVQQRRKFSRFALISSITIWGGFGLFVLIFAFMF